MNYRRGWTNSSICWVSRLLGFPTRRLLAWEGPGRTLAPASEPALSPLLCRFLDAGEHKAMYGR